MQPKFIRLGLGGSTTPSPPSSPRRSSPRVHRRTAKLGGAVRPPPPRSLVQRVAGAVLSLLLRRQAVFLFAPLIYVGMMIFCVGTISLESMPRIISRPAPGSLYRSPQLFRRLKADMDADNSTDAVCLCVIPLKLFKFLDKIICIFICCLDLSSLRLIWSSLIKKIASLK